MGRNKHISGPDKEDIVYYSIFNEISMNPKAPAFPAEFGPQGERSGLTIRDYIAIEAMKSIVTASYENTVSFQKVADAEKQSITALIAQASYDMADILIAESNKKK